jgi:hypothetical protein
MASFEWKKKLLIVQDWWARLMLACHLPDHALFLIYERIAGEVECKCCVFYRGVLFGIFWQCLIVLVAVLLGNYYGS